MPADVDVMDVVALAWMVAMWAAYGLLVDRDLRVGRPSLNRLMADLRRHWVERMLDRDIRIMDSQLVGHSINSVTFFASTTTIVIAALAGVLGSLNGTIPFAGHLTFVADTSIELFETKLFVLLAIFVVAFFSFTWALRQYNYCCALIGAAPVHTSSKASRDAAARPIAAMMTMAIGSFNNGLRAYYFAVATLAWFAGPWLFIAASTAVLALLARRQLASPAREAVAAQVAAHDVE
jgi:uncharacterized membrane protein